jgi:hypothetical protein
MRRIRSVALRALVIGAATLLSLASIAVALADNVGYP